MCQQRFDILERANARRDAHVDDLRGTLDQLTAVSPQPRAPVPTTADVKRLVAEALTVRHRNDDESVRTLVLDAMSEVRKTFETDIKKALAAKQQAEEARMLTLLKEPTHAKPWKSKSGRWSRHVARPSPASTQPAQLPPRGERSSHAETRHAATHTQRI